MESRAFSSSSTALLLHVVLVLLCCISVVNAMPATGRGPKEHVAYTVLKPSNETSPLRSYEIRQYAPQVRVETTAAVRGGGGDKRGANGARKRLADYIGKRSVPPQNSRREKIKKTMPVAIISLDDNANNSRRIAFVLPQSMYSRLQDAPIPLNPNVTLRSVPTETRAVMIVRGNLKLSQMAPKLIQLAAMLREDGVKLSKNIKFEVYRYGPKWVSGELRKLAVSVCVEYDTKATPNERTPSATALAATIQAVVSNKTRV